MEIGDRRGTIWRDLRGMFSLEIIQDVCAEIWERHRSEVAALHVSPQVAVEIQKERDKNPIFTPRMDSFLDWMGAHHVLILLNQTTGSLMSVILEPEYTGEHLAFETEEGPFYELTFTPIGRR